MALSCPECGLALSRFVNGGQCPLCERKDPSTETTASEVDLSEHTVPSARAPDPAPEEEEFSATVPGMPAPVPRHAPPASLSVFLTAVGAAPVASARASAKPAPSRAAPLAAPPPPRTPVAMATPPPVATPVPIPGVPYVRPAPPPAPAPTSLVPPPRRQPQRTNPSGQPLPAPAAFSAAVSAIPAPPPLFTATEATVPETSPAAPPMSAAFAKANAAPGESPPPADAEPVEPMELQTSGGALRDAGPEAAEDRAPAPSMPELLPGTTEVEDAALELAEPPRAPARPPASPAPATVPGAIAAPPVQTTRAPATAPPAQPTAVAALPARRGIAPPLAVAGIAVGLLLGFFAGRLSGPRASEPTRVAATPVPTLPLYPVAVTSPVTTPVTTPSGVPSGTSVTVAAMTAAPSPTPTAVAAVATPKAESRPPATTATRGLVGTVADARALESAGKSEAAAAALGAIVKAEPANAEAHWALANAYRAKKKGPKACQEFRAYVKNAPAGENAAEAKRHLDICRAVTLLDQEKLPEATAAFAEIVRANWTFADGHYWLGTMQSLNNENAAACSSFKSYLRLDAKGPYVDRATAQLAALGC